MEPKKIIAFSVQMKTSYMFDFLYWHSYHGFLGITNYALSLVGVIALLAGFGKDNVPVTILLVILAALFTVINPLLLYFKAAGQVKRSPMFAKPLQYEFDENGFSVSQGETKDFAGWDAVIFLREPRKSIILYLGATNALILPKKEIGDQQEAFKDLIRVTLLQQAKKLKK